MKTYRVDDSLISPWLFLCVDPSQDMFIRPMSGLGSFRIRAVLSSSELARPDQIVLTFSSSSWRRHNQCSVRVSDLGMVDTVTNILVSGEAPEVPVLSRVSGNVFEKRLLDSYVAEHGKDPVNGEDMGTDDIVEIKTSRVVRPRPPNAASIPSLLSIFQNEWDALALETYAVRQQLHQTRQELSTLLYQHDAACRVIARITKERDEAREALSSVSQNINGSNHAEVMDVDITEGEMPEEVTSIVSATMEKESAGRKKRKVPESWTHAEDLASLAPSEASPQDLALLEIPELAEAQETVDVVGVALHPSKQIIASARGNGRWTLDKPEVGFPRLARVTNQADIVSLAFHPDGHLLALGCQDGNVYIFHLLTSKVEAVFGPAAGPIVSLSFSENGFWLAVASTAEANVKVWHLGKATIAAELEVSLGTSCVAWDHSGQFLACVGSSGIKIWAYTKAGKRWSTAFESAGEYDKVVWQADARGLVLNGSEGNTALRIE